LKNIVAFVEFKRNASLDISLTEDGSDRDEIGIFASALIPIV
jgi:hypothetical protein